MWDIVSRVEQWFYLDLEYLSEKFVKTVLFSVQVEW